MAALVSASIGPALVRPIQGAKTPGNLSFQEILAHTPKEASRTPPAGESRSLLPNALDHLEAGRQRLDQIVAEARQGRTYRPQELLALQAEVYRLTEEFGAVQKVVEEGLNGMKRLWTMQI